MAKEETLKLVEIMLSYAQSPSEVIRKINDFEKRHLRYVHDTQINPFFHHFEHVFEELCNMIFAVNYVDKKDWPKHRVVQYLIVSNN
ncbi:MAG: hypothetical protein ABIJ45_05060, partial [Candidatus Zixiibacteriota bacterium]